MCLPPCMYVCMNVCMYVQYVWCPKRPEEGVRSPGTGVTDCCESPYGYWETNTGPLQEQQVLLVDKLLFQPNLFSFIL